jgi:sugar phosphate permease
LFFSIPYNVGPNNISLLLAEKGMGNAGTAGLLSGLFLFGLGFSSNLISYIIFSVIGGMSLPLVLPQSSLGVVQNKKKSQYAMATAVLMALGNVGAFLAPVNTSLARVATGSEAVSVRMLFAASFSILCAAITTFIFFRQRNNK